MLRFAKERWAGNGWPSIEFTPNDVRYFPRVLYYLSTRYHIPMPQMIDTIDGYAAEFTLLGAPAVALVDTWSFSVAFSDEPVREQVWRDLGDLAEDYFEVGD